MEVFGLFKHRHVSGGRAPPPSAAATIATSALRPSTDTEDDVCDDEGPFFDLEFAAPDEEGESHVSGSDAEDDDLTACSERSCSGGRAAWSEACSHSPSPSDDLFFRGPTSLLFATSEPRSKPAASQPKSSAKLRVLLLGFRKPKETPAVTPGGGAAASPESRKQRPRSKFSLRLKVEEVPIVSLFTKTAKPHSDGGRASKDALQRYLSKIKPLYVRVSRRYAEKLGFSGHLGSPVGDGAETGSPPPPASGACKTQRLHSSAGSNLQSGLRVVCRRLGKSRSASAAVAAVRSPPARRRDDTLLELQDGIQNAILHCKRSFNEGRGSAETVQPLVRSRSDPGEERAAAAAAAARKG